MHSFLSRPVQASFTGLTLALSLILTTGCGSDGNRLVKDVTGGAFTRDGDAYGNLEITLGTGALRLPSVELPVINRRTGQQMGTLALVNGLDGDPRLRVELNISEAANLDSADARLPNGSQIPVSGLGDAEVVGFAVGNSGARVYLALDDKVAMLGAALPIRALDRVGEEVPLPLNLFPQFEKNGIRGTAGIFTSPNAGQSGVAVFADLSKVVHRKLKKLAQAENLVMSSTELAEAQVKKDCKRNKKGKCIKKRKRAHRKSGNQLKFGQKESIQSDHQAKAEKRLIKLYQEGE